MLHQVSRYRNKCAALTIVLLAAPLQLSAQSTQAVLLGAVVERGTGTPVPNAAVVAYRLSGEKTYRGAVDGQGRYALLGITPGAYRVRACFDHAGQECSSDESHQALEIGHLDIPVGGIIRLDFHLRPSLDVFDQTSLLQLDSDYDPAPVVIFYGPDQDATRSVRVTPPRQSYRSLDTTVSFLVDPTELAALPFFGRDTYSLLATQPSVASDLSSLRGLGLSVAGLRPGAGAFLLDGQNITSGLVLEPLASAPPEFLQEYRLSLSNYTPEFGGTAGFVANAVSLSGGSAWHGLLYGYLRNEALNANDFQRNATAGRRLPFRESQTGIQAGGPLLRGRLLRGKLFGSVAWESLRSRGRLEEINLAVPSQYLLEQAKLFQPDTTGTGLLIRYPSPFSRPATADLISRSRYAPPNSLDRWTALARLDGIFANGRHAWMLRALGADRDWDDFIWSPYPDFVSALRQPSVAVVAQLHSSSAGFDNQLRAGWTSDWTRWDRANPAVPTLQAGFTVSPGSLQSTNTTLPGSPASYGFSYRRRTIEINESVALVRGRHLVQTGGGSFLRSTWSLQTTARDGLYRFTDVLAFLGDRSNGSSLAIARGSYSGGRVVNAVSPDFVLSGRGTDPFAFLQDRIRLSPRFSVNVGLRYESRSPVDLTTGAQTAPWIPRSAFESRAHNWGARVGLAVSLDKARHFSFRTGYGIYFDVPADNIWLPLRDNGTVVVQSDDTSGALIQNVLAPLSTRLSSLNGSAVRIDARYATLLHLGKDLQRGYAQHLLAGVAWNPNRRLTAEVTGAGTLGRHLVVTDVLQRNTTTEYRLRSAEGLSDYYALDTSVRYQGERFILRLQHTWAHAIDVQSDAFAGETGDIGILTPRALPQRRPDPALTYEADTRADRASADFDQRQSLSLVALWRPRAIAWNRTFTRITSNWSVSSIAAFRTGFPFSVYVPGTPSLLARNPRALLSGATAPESTRLTVPSGVRILDPAAFTPASAGFMTGRNSFRAPGTSGVDGSIARRLPIRREGGMALTIRADVFNVLNHANLGPPANIFGAAGFGVSLYGRKSAAVGLPFLSPGAESPRQMQLMLRFEF